MNNEELDKALEELAEMDTDEVFIWADTLDESDAIRLTADVTSVLSRLKRAEAENEQLRLAICGGEDAPGYAASLPLASILDVAEQNTRSPPPPVVEGGEPIELDAARIAEVVAEGDGFWRSCSGCLETEDGQNVHGFPHSKALGCVLGGGCGECGGIGAIWDTTDYGDMARSILEDERTTPPRIGREEIEAIIRTEMRALDITPDGYTTVSVRAAQAILSRLGLEGDNAK